MAKEKAVKEVKEKVEDVKVKTEVAEAQVDVKDNKTEMKSEAPAEAPVVKERKEEKAGIVYIYASPNNTIIHFTDLAGNTLSRVSGGMITKHSRLKADPTIAMFIVKKAAERARDLGINAVYVRTRGKTGAEGIGSGAHAAVKSLEKEGFKVINVLDTTRVPRGGPKRPGGKRGRRV